MAKQHKTNKAGHLRIIGGNWRGRKLQFPEADGLRPTGDRVRETVFNWLQPVLGGSRCLDCFAGSGALGFEAASRGAGSVVMIEADRQAYQFLSNNAELLQADNCELVHGRVEHYLRSAQPPFDVVFLDPPYQANVWSDIANLLTDRDLLSEGARIYLEYPRREPPPVLPQSWHCLKEKQAGDVKYALFDFHAGASE